MRILFSLIFLLSLVHSIATAAPNSFALSEESQVDLLIQAAQNNLNNLTNLKKALEAFRVQEAICLDDPENGDQLFLLSQKSYDLKHILAQCHIDDYFRPQFLIEINQLSKSAEKPTVPAMNRDIIQ